MGDRIVTGLLDARYELLRIEGRIDYYIELYSKAYRTSRMKAARESSGNNIWKMTSEALEVVLIRLKLIKKEVAKARFSPVPFQVADAVKMLRELRFQITERPCYPPIKKSLEAMISDLEIELRKISSHA